MTSRDVQRDSDRRRVIIEAARSCFLQFGYGKTSLDDIAKRAGLSRPLLYRKFKNKQDIFGAVYDDTFDACYPAAAEVLAGRGSKRDKLLRICEIVVVAPWEHVMSSPMAREFYEACMLVVPEIAAKHERKFLDLTRELVGGREAAEVFSCAVDGIMFDIPSAGVLRKRLNVLVDRFAA